MAVEFARELRQQGITAAKAGRKDEARELLQKSIRVDPKNEAAWLWLASVARDQRERIFCLNKVLEINPNHEAALRALQAARDEAPAQEANASSLGLKKIAALRESQQQPAVPTATQTTHAAAEEAASEPPGVPIPSAESISAAQRQVEALIRSYTAPVESSVRWTQKMRRRAGEGDIVRLRLTIAAAALSFVAVLALIGTAIVLTNDDLRSIVLAPTATPSSTPTVTPTHTPGMTPTPSPQPRRSATPTPTVPASISAANLYAPPTITPIYPPVLERPLQDAIAAINRGFVAQALPTIAAERRLTSGRFNPNPYYYEALAYLAEQDYEAALETLEDAETRLPEAPNDNFKPLIDSGFAQTYLAMAQAALAAGETARVSELLQQAQERAEAAIEGDPRLADPYLVLARRYTLDGNYTDALSALDQGLDVSALSSNVRLITERGEIYFLQREYDLARYQAFLALYIDPTTEAAHRLQIRAALADNQPGQAVLDAQTYLLYYPGSAVAYKLLGDARMAEGNLDLALVAYSQALTGRTTTSEGYVDALLARAALYTRQGRHALALADLNRALDLTDDPVVQMQRMNAAYADGRYEIALQDVNELTGHGVVPEIQLQLMRARILIDQADEDAESASQPYLEASNLLIPLLSAAETTPDMLPIIHEYAARAQLALGNESAALTSIDLALAAGETGRRRYLRGLILEAQGEEDEARLEYEWVVSWGRVFPFDFILDAEDRLLALQDS